MTVLMTVRTPEEKGGYARAEPRARSPRGGTRDWICVLGGGLATKANCDARANRVANGNKPILRRNTHSRPPSPPSLFPVLASLRRLTLPRNDRDDDIGLRGCVVEVGGTVMVRRRSSASGRLHGVFSYMLYPVSINATILYWQWVNLRDWRTTTHTIPSTSGICAIPFSATLIAATLNLPSVWLPSAAYACSLDNRSLSLSQLAITDEPKPRPPYNCWLRLQKTRQNAFRNKIWSNWQSERRWSKWEMLMRNFINEILIAAVHIAFYLRV